jgi:hypothetical protein
LDVGFAIIEVCNDFLEIFQEQFFVVQKLLAFDEAGVGILGYIFALLQDCHGIVMLLAEE